MRSLLFVSVVLLAAPAALALPQYAVRSARACDTCHVDPKGWEDPSVDLRKCTLNCNGCHVSPGGGGMRTESGRFYGEQVLPMFGSRPADSAYEPVELVPTSQPTTVAASQPTTVAASQPTAPSSQPTGERVAAPGTAGRYGGIEPHPFFQWGLDWRGMIYVPFDGDTNGDAPGGKHPHGADGFQIFPMQLDVHLALRPYNPAQLNEGRLTLLVTPGIEGKRTNAGDDVHHRIFLKEYWAMYHDLPYQLYARVGRFLPIHGWRLDDHTIFTRQSQSLMGAAFDLERQVTGVEVGINPNYFYGHLSLFNAAQSNLKFAGDEAFESPIKSEDGWGGALAVGYRELAWQLGVSELVGVRSENVGGTDEDISQFMTSVQAALNFEVIWDWLPLIYLGEYHINIEDRLGESEKRTGLSAWHEIGWMFVTGMNSKVRYEWIDPDTDYAYDSRHRLAVGLEFHPYKYVTLMGQYRHNWVNDEDRFEFGADEVFWQLHGYY